MDINLKALYQFIRFGFVGLANTLIDFCVYIVLTRTVPYFSDQIYIANAIAFSAAATFSLFANKRWTFSRTDRVTKHEAVKFYGTAIIGFLLGTLTLYILVSHFGVNDIYAKVCATAVTVIWNFFLSKFWVFKKHQQ